MASAPRYQPAQKSGSEVSLFVKYTLFSLNVLFWLFGLVMVVIGIYAKTVKSYGELSSSLPWFMDPANLFVVVGSMIFILAFLGCVGSLRENVILLKSFKYTLITLLVVEVVVAVYIYVDSGRVRKRVGHVLRDTIPRYRDDDDLQSIIDWTQEEFACCGVHGVDDWNGNVYFNCSVRSYPNPERCGVPFSCCKDYKTVKNRQCGYKMREAKNEGVRGEKIYTVGCVEAVIKNLLDEENIVLLLVTGGAVVLLQLITVGLTHVLLGGIERQMSTNADSGGGGGSGENVNYGRMETIS